MKALFGSVVLVVLCSASVRAQSATPVDDNPAARVASYHMFSTLQFPGDTVAQAPMPTARVRKPAIALGLSILVPGSGQIYNGQVAKGLVIAGLFYGGVAMANLADITRAHRSITGYGWMSVVTIFGSGLWGMIDAATTADRLSDQAAQPGHAVEMQVGGHPVSVDAAVLPNAAAIRIGWGI